TGAVRRRCPCHPLRFGSGAPALHASPAAVQERLRVAAGTEPTTFAQLAKIIEHLVSNATRYYEREALVADPDYGSILSSLLVQRHRMSAGTTTPPSNSTATLLYGKNNVRVQPKDIEEPMPGYLSLHQTAAGLIIKWTPNQLMNGYAESEGIDKSVYWAMSLQVCVWEVVYVHVHRSQASDALILVGQDGVQRPPIHFPKGGHLLSFLSNLETGLLPQGQLDPPLWSQRGTGKSGETEEAEWEESAGDYVFRIVNNAITDREEGIEGGITEELWRTMTDEKGAVNDKDEVYRLVYYSGVQHEIRKEVWPYLLGYYEFGSTAHERVEQDIECRKQYETVMSEWLCVEAIVKQRDREQTAASIARLSEASGRLKPVEKEEPEVFEDDCSVISDNPPVVSPEPSEAEQKKPDKAILSRAPSIDGIENIDLDEERQKDDKKNEETEIDSDKIHIKSVVDNPDMRRESIAEIKKIAEGMVQKGEGRGLLCSVDSGNGNLNGNDIRSSIDEPSHQHTSVIITNPSVDLVATGSPASEGTTGVVREESHSAGQSFDTLEPSNEQRAENRSNCVSPASSNGGVYSSFNTLEQSNEQRAENRSNCVSPASSNGGVYSVSILTSPSTR
ncbi:Uncharacterized protein OBRU01_09765, partial [Operophtera brumata]